MGFEEVVVAIHEKKLLDILEHPNRKKYTNQKIFVIEISQYAQLTLNKTRNINIRIPEKDLVKIKSIAVEKGVPQQTLLASVIHQYLTKHDGLLP